MCVPPPAVSSVYIRKRVWAILKAQVQFQIDRATHQGKKKLSAHIPGVWTSVSTMKKVEKLIIPNVAHHSNSAQHNICSLSLKAGLTFIEIQTANT